MPKSPKKQKTKKYKSEIDDLNAYDSGSYKKPVGKSSYSNNNKNLDYLNNYTPLPKSNLYQPLVPTLSSYKTGATTINQLAPVKTYVPQYFPVRKQHNNPLNAGSTSAPYQSLQSASALLPTLESIKSTLAPFNTNPTSSYFNPSTDFAQPTEPKAQKVDDYFDNPSSFDSSKQYAQPTEYKSQQVKGGRNNCQKVAKQLSPEDISHGRFRRQADKMNCYLCTDPKSGGTYEQCSYTSDPENDGSYFRGHAEKYSTRSHSNPEHYRRKRAAGNKNDRRNKRKHNDEKQEEEEEKYSNPFNYEKQNAHKLNSKPDEFDDSSYYKAPDFSHYEKADESYRFGPEYFTDSTNSEKSYSELQSDELKKSGDNCKKVKKDSMTCMVCSNPKTGGNYEQCSYTSEPQEKKYAYVKEKKYSSDDPQGEEKVVESTDSKPTIQSSKTNNKSRYNYKPRKNVDSSHFSASTKHPKKVTTEDHNDYTIPHHFISNSKDELKSKFDYDPDTKSGNERQRVNNGKTNNNKNEEDEEKEKEDYVYKLFPEYAEKESKNREVKQKPGFEYHSDLPEYFTAEESKKDVDSVLQEFSKKDRSKCKKVAKDKMTCYLCVDDKGVQHEECMFVSESQPKSSHIAYHEVKEFSTDPKRKSAEPLREEQEDEEEAATNAKQSTAKAPVKRKAYPKKATPLIIKDVEAEPTEYVKSANYKSPRIVRRKTNISKDFLSATPGLSKKTDVKVKRNSNHNKNENSQKRQREEVEEPVEPETENGDGAYATELRPVYSKKLGMTLPAYMLDISEGEKIFDEAVKG